MLIFILVVTYKTWQDLKRIYFLKNLIIHLGYVSFYNDIFIFNTYSKVLFSIIL